MRKVLVAVDGSAPAERAIRWLIDAVTAGNLPADGRQVHVINVQPVLPERLEQTMSRAILEEYYSAQALAELAVALRLLGEARIDYQQHLLRGAPARLILDCASAQACELIVMGRHGAGVVRELLLGSVASAVLRAAGQPVLLVP